MDRAIKLLDKIVFVALVKSKRNVNKMAIFSSSRRNIDRAISLLEKILLVASAKSKSKQFSAHQGEIWIEISTS